MIGLAESDMIYETPPEYKGVLMSFCSTESAMLVQYTSGTEKLSWHLTRERPILIGRSEQCDLTFPVRDISRKHAQITWDNGAYYLEDLGSCNGTKLNNRSCRQAEPLRNGDEIQLGDEIVVFFVDDESTQPLPHVGENRGLGIDHTNRTLLIDGQPLLKPLSPSQYKMVNLLYNANEQIVTRQEIVEEVWADESYHGVSEQAIDALARRIRLQIAEIAPGVDYLQTVRGHGFRLLRRTQ